MTMTMELYELDDSELDGVAGGPVPLAVKVGFWLATGAAALYANHRGYENNRDNRYPPNWN